jgi:hypothetical protein
LLDVLYGTVGQDHSMLHAVAVRNVEGFAGVIQNHLPVFWMDAVPENDMTHLDFAGLKSQDPKGLIRPVHAVGIGIPFPTADLGQAFRIRVCNLRATRIE